MQTMTMFRSERFKPYLLATSFLFDKVKRFTLGNLGGVWHISSCLKDGGPVGVGCGGGGLGGGGVPSLSFLFKVDLFLCDEELWGGVLILNRIKIMP